MEEKQVWKRRRRGNKMMKEDEKADFISLLPDHLLHEILAFIPARIAVSTSLLSRRWRAVWQSSPDLSITELSLSSVDSILRLRDPAVPLRTFSLDASYDVDVVSDAARVHSWIRYAANPALQQLKIILNLRNVAFHSFRLSLLTVFHLPNLRVLELRFPRMVPSFDWPVDAFLPSLERLDLEIKNIGHAGLDAIPKSCPALKHWRMVLYDATAVELDVNCPLLEDFDLTICIRKMERLKICGPNLREVRLKQISVHDEWDYLKISAPGLRTLKLVGLLPCSAASVATVVIDPLPADSIVSSFTTWPVMLLPYYRSVDGGAVLNAGLAAFRVNRLNFSEFSITEEIGKLIFNRRNEENPPEEKYENLKHLELAAYFGGFGSLGVAFWLNKFSKIETLQISSLGRGSSDYLDVFQEYFQAKGGFGPGGYWDSNNFRLEKLVRVSMHGLFRCKYEYEFLEFLLRTATSLRKITISLNCKYHHPSEVINVQKVEQLRQSFPDIEILLQ